MSKQVSYTIEGLYRVRGSTQRKWEVWMRADTKQQALGTYEAGKKMIRKDDGFSALRVVELVGTIIKED